MKILSDSPECSGTHPALPEFRILIVEDDPLFQGELVLYLQELGVEFYDLKISECDNVAEGLRYLEEALDSERPFDGVILDFRLPPSAGEHPEPSTDLAKFCVFNPECSRYTAQLTTHVTDPNVLAFWPKDGKAHRFQGGLFEKNSTSLSAIAKDMFFTEIKEPLRSDWLLAELGAVETVMGRSSAPKGFNIYRFIQRLGATWPHLGEEVKRRASELFSIEVGNLPTDPPLRIGFKSFANPAAES